MANQVEIFIVLRQIRKFLEDAGKAAGAIHKIGTEGETAGKKVKLSAAGLAKWAGGAAAIYGATRFIKSAVEDTVTLARSTRSLTVSTGMDTKTASEWVGVLGERNIAVKTFQVGLKTLSKQMETARLGTAASSAVTKRLRAEIDAVAAAGGKNAPKQIAKLSTQLYRAENAGARARKAFAGLGISADAIARRDTGEVLLELADGLQRIPPGAQRMAAATAVLGRSGTTLLPVLSQGREAVQQLLDEQDKMGKALTGKQLQAVMRYIKEQRHLRGEWEGAKIQIALALMPVLTLLTHALGKLADALNPVTHNTVALTIAMGVLGLIALGFVGLQIAFKIAMIRMAWAMRVAAGAAVELDAAMLPLWITIGIILLAIILLGVEVYELVKHYRAINQFWADVWQGLKDIYNWITGHWKGLAEILAAPFLPLAMLVVTLVNHFDDVKRAFVSLVEWVTSKLSALLDWIGTKARQAAQTVADIVPGGGLLYSAGGAVAGALGYASGGTVGMTGNYLVGEHGPEIVTMPRGAYVTPNSVLAATAGGNGRQLPPLELTVPVVVDGREIARAVARVSADRQARR